MTVWRDMLAMVLEASGKPMIMKRVPVPTPSSRQVLVKVIACGVCRTDLHIIDGELPDAKFPLIPGHEIIGIIEDIGPDVKTLRAGEVVGIPWLAYTCGKCKYCQRGQENICDNAIFTGYTIDGGYAEYCIGNENFCFPIIKQYANAHGAPLMCAGLIGYRSYTKISATAEKIGIYGFGAAAHILIQIARYQGKQVYAFTKPGDIAAQKFALAMGAVWAGDSLSKLPEKLDAAIIFAPTGDLVPLALLNVDKGGSIVCGGIHMSDIPSFKYGSLWGEKSLYSVANLTRRDGKNFLRLVPQIPIRTEVQTFRLDQANEAVTALRTGHIHGAGVLIMD